MIGKIKENYCNLTKSEKKALYYILEHNNSLYDKTSQAIATKCRVSKTVVINMAQKLGFSGFNELKFYLQERNSETNVIEKKVSNRQLLIDSVARTVELNSNDALDMVATEIVKSTCIFVIASGTTKAMSYYFGYLLLSLNINCIINPDMNLLNTLAQTTRKDELFIALSLSGSTKEIVEAAKLIKAKYNKLISITSFTANELSLLSDVSIFCFGLEKKSKRTDTVSRISMMAAIDIIVDHVKLKKKN